MFGYATDETPELMPLTIMLAHKLNEKMTELRKSNVLGWLRADSKTQVRAMLSCASSDHPSIPGPFQTHRLLSNTRTKTEPWSLSASTRS